MLTGSVARAGDPHRDFGVSRSSACRSPADPSLFFSHLVWRDDIGPDVSDADRQCVVTSILVGTSRHRLAPRSTRRQAKAEPKHRGCHIGRLVVTCVFEGRRMEEASPVPLKLNGAVPKPATTRRASTALVTKWRAESVTTAVP